MTEAPKLSLACASRSRVEMMRTALESARSLAHNWSQVEVVLRVDSCDPLVMSYDKLAKDFGANLIVGQRGLKGAAPYLNEAAMEAEGDFILQFTDDLVVRTPEWDRLFLEHATKVDPNEPAAFIYDEKWATHGNPAVNRAWLERAGCFYPSDSVHFFVDTILFEVAKKTNRLYPIPICIQHLKAKGDELFREIRQQDQNMDRVKAWRSELMELMK